MISVGPLGVSREESDYGFAIVKPVNSYRDIFFDCSYADPDYLDRSTSTTWRAKAELSGFSRQPQHCLCRKNMRSTSVCSTAVACCCQPLPRSRIPVMRFLSKEQSKRRSCACCFRFWWGREGRSSPSQSSVVSTLPATRSWTRLTVTLPQR